MMRRGSAVRARPTSRRTAGYLAVALLDAVLASSPSPRARRWRWLTKPALMPLLMPGRDRGTQTALALAGAGDVALLGSGQAALGVGLAAFGGSHLAWIDVLAARRGQGDPAVSSPWRAVASAGYVTAALGLTRYLWPRTGALRVPVLGYAAVLLTMGLVALRAPSHRAALGGGLFILSDSLLSVRIFGEVDLPKHDALIMLTYTAAQALLTTDSVAVQPVSGLPVP